MPDDKPYVTSAAARRRFPRWLAVVAGLTMSMDAGCASRMGSRSLPDVRIDYTAAIARSAEQQMLLNLVRMRHIRLPVFLQVSSVVTQYALSTNVGVNGTYSAVGPGGFVPPGSAGASLGVTVEERPTITYTPLQGEEFVRRLGTPLSAETVAQLAQAGWPWEAVLTCCVQQINGQFAPPSPGRDEHSDFQRLGGMMTRLQATHALAVLPGPDGPEIVFARPGTAEGRREAAEVRELLGLEPNVHRFALSRPGLLAEGTTVTLHGRSLVAALYYVAQGVQAPARLGPDLGDNALLRVRAVDKAPEHAYASVEYDGKTFYIDGEDSESQHVFVLLMYLFSLMSAPGGAGPVVTVGAGA